MLEIGRICFEEIPGFCDIVCLSGTDISSLKSIRLVVKQLVFKDCRKSRGVHIAARFYT